MSKRKIDRSARFKLLREMQLHGLLKMLEIRSALPSRKVPADGFLEVDTFFGRRMKVLSSECVSKYIAAQGFFEPTLCAILILLLKPGMVFFDIGAHYGFHSLLASLLVGRCGAVHAFEPTKTTWEVLQKNAQGSVNIQAHNFALWSSSGGRLFREFGAAYSAFNTFFDPRLPLQERSALRTDSVIVETQTVDRFVRERDLRPDFIKIDAESSEMEILKGMDRTIAECRPIITLEVGDQNIPDVCLTRDLIQYLTQKGYKPFEYRAGKISGHSLQDHYDYDNLLFLPSGSSVDGAG